MEFLGFMVLFLVILAATAGTSSDRDGRGRYDRYDNQWGNYHYGYPPYPPYPPPNWPPRRRNRFGELIFAFFMGILAVSLVVGGLLVYSSKDIEKPEEPIVEQVSPPTLPITPDVPYDPPLEEGDKGGAEVDEEEEFVAKVLRLEKSDNVHYIKLAVTDEANFQKLKKEHYDLPIEGFLDNGRVFALIFAKNPQERQQWGNIIQLRYGESPNFVLQNFDFPVHDIWNGNIVKYAGSECWVCEQ